MKYTVFKFSDFTRDMHNDSLCCTKHSNIVSLLLKAVKQSTKN